MPFSTFKLSLAIQTAIIRHNFTKPTAVQEQVIPLVLDHKDVMAQAQTGTGKSASFVLPILERLSQETYEGKAKIKVLVLTPTRELTLQVAETFRSFGGSLAQVPKVVAIVGGEGLGDQMIALQQGCDIVVATSGRLLEILKKKQIFLNKIEFFVLDEADKMLDLGFEQELDLILKSLPEKRQNLLFSATYPDKIVSMAEKITQDAIKVSIESEDVKTAETITQRSIAVSSENRGPLLRDLLKNNDWKLTLVFMANKRAASNIAEKFRKHGIKADAFHGGLEQSERNYLMDAFKAKKFNVLFATDLVSRGLDIDDIDCVINFDLPRSPADYVHRIGRTGRAGKEGMAISFVPHEDEQHFRLIEKRSQIRLEREKIAGFELEGGAPRKERGPQPVKGKKKSKKDKLREQAAKEQS